MMKTFEDRLRETIAQMPHGQGPRINATLQVAFNVALANELAMGHPIDDKALCEGVANGIAAILMNIRINRTEQENEDAGKFEVQEIMRFLVKCYKHISTSKAAVLNVERVTVNQAVGRA